MNTLASATGPMWLRVMEERQSAPPPIAGDPIWPYVLGVLGLCVVIALLVWWVWRRQRTDPRELAFNRLSRRIGLSTTERSAVRQLAKIHGDATPVAMLISSSAIRYAAEKLRRVDPTSPLIEQAAALSRG